MVENLVTIGTKVEGRIVAEVGELFDIGLGDALIPVKFENGEYAVLWWVWYVKVLSIWEPDNEQDVEAIKNFKEMPTVHHSLKEDTFFTQCKNANEYKIVILYKDGAPERLVI